MPLVVVQARSALFQQKENWATMTGDVFIKSATGWIRGDSGRAELLPDTYKPKLVTIRDHVTGKRRPFVRFFACGEDLSHEPPDAPLPDALARGSEPLVILGAIAGG